MRNGLDKPLHICLLSITIPVKRKAHAMTKPHILQMGPYPEWDQLPLDEQFTIHRYYSAMDRAANWRASLVSTDLERSEADLRADSSNMKVNELMAVL